MQPQLFDRMERDAVLSPCGAYRYRLSRVWDRDINQAVFVMLNPSTADATQDDPTIRRCVGFARSWGCGGLAVVNLFALRATDPDAVWGSLQPIGPDNDRHILDAAAAGLPVVAAWGVHGTCRFRNRVVAGMLRAGGVALKCLGLTKDGHPRHPLYVRGDAPLIDYPQPEG